MAYDFSRLKVVVVDDNQYMRSVFREFLRSISLEPDNIRDVIGGEEAMGVIAAFGPDLVITDYLMEPMNGLELTRRIRRDPESPDPYVPIIICTGYTETKYVEAARDAGAHEVLAKPITATTLYSRIRSIIENPRLFVKLDTFHGPDRRRRVEKVKRDRRKHNPPPLRDAEAESGGGAPDAPVGNAVADKDDS